jgi:hypothetical protein
MDCPRAPSPHGMLERREVRRLSVSPLMNGLDDKPVVSLSASPNFSTLMRRRSLSASGSFADLPLGSPPQLKLAAERGRHARSSSENPSGGAESALGNQVRPLHGRKSLLRGSSDESESKNSNSGYGSGGDWGRGGGGDDQSSPFDGDGDIVREIGRTTSGSESPNSVLSTASRAARKGSRPLAPNGK